jgi:hypothetical protein
LVPSPQIGHAVAKHPSTPTWAVLNAQEKEIIMRSEGIDPVENDCCWSCNHCTIHLDGFQTRSKVIDHLKAVYVLLLKYNFSFSHDYRHNIVKWNNPQDLFLIPQKRRSLLLIPIFAMSTKVMRCKHCPSNSSRLFDLCGVKMHLRDK